MCPTKLSLFSILWTCFKITFAVNFYNNEDVERGYVEVANRKGIIEQFALTSISIGVVIVEKGRFSNILEIGDVGAQVKHVAKSIMGSSYAIDRRQTH